MSASSPASEPPRDSGLYREENAYDLLRLLLAATVIVGHSFLFVGDRTSPIDAFFRYQKPIGQIAVLGFFGLSGFLVAASCDRSRSVWSFLLKRVRRIFPAFWMCLLVTAFAAAPLIALGRGIPLASLVTDPAEAFGYVWRNALLYIFQPSIGNVVANQPADLALLNGSLWSLAPEFLCYLGLAVIGVTGLLRTNRALLLVALAILLCFRSVAAAGARVPPLIPFVAADIYLSFAVGVTLFAWREQFLPSRAVAIGLVVALLFLLRGGGFDIAGPVVVALAAVFAGAVVRVRLPHDFSYGLYIYSFPVQQVLAAHYDGWSRPTFIAASLVLSLACAALSWFLIERRFHSARPPADARTSRATAAAFPSANVVESP